MFLTAFSPFLSVFQLTLFLVAGVVSLLTGGVNHNSAFWNFQFSTLYLLFKNIDGLLLQETTFSIFLIALTALCEDVSNQNWRTRDSPVFGHKQDESMLSSYKGATNEYCLTLRTWANGNFILCFGFYFAKCLHLNLLNIYEPTLNWKRKCSSPLLLPT